MRTSIRPRFCLRAPFAILLFLFCLPVCTAGQASPAQDSASALYKQLRNAATLTSGVHIENLVLVRDRVKIDFTAGMMYFPAPAAGRIRSAVFVGFGTIHASPPEGSFEKANLLRLLKEDNVTSDFRTAVLRFTDDSDVLLAKSAAIVGEVPEQARRLAEGLEPRLLRETGMNISARQMESILNHEDPGVFLAQFEGGKRGRFTFLFDPPSRIPVVNFRLNAGEKGLIFARDETLYFNDIWMAFYTQAEYAEGRVKYADTHNLVSTQKCTLTLDLMEPQKVLGLSAKMQLVSRVADLRVIPFAVGEDLSERDDERRKKQLHILGAHLADGTTLEFVQEPWEGGFEVVLPSGIGAGQSIDLRLDLKGDFMMESDTVSGTYFPRSTTTWYPRHGYLERSTFDISIVHRKRERVVSIGEMVQDGAAPGTKDAVLTQFRMDQPVSLATFAAGPYEIHRDVAKEDNGRSLPLEFYSMPGSRAVIKEDFILAEMNNAIRFFSLMFGEYPYPLFRGAYHPFGFGQGFPTTIMIPNADKANYRTYSFIAHETSHQWWGDIVLWRSYRDQWLSEGFADYSGMLYTQLRDKTHSENELIRRAREELKLSPRTLTGIGPGRLVDVGPLIMGHRVQTRETLGSYQALTYSKGALVLRMLHFLLTDPQTGDGKPFFDLMSDFVSRYKNHAASTEQFFAVADEHLKSTPLAQKFGYSNLSWFYRQWVTEAYLPSYELTYHIEDDPGGGVILKGEVLQKGLPEHSDWFMPLPVLIHFSGGKGARATVAARGDRSPVTIKLPLRPEKVELDPELWILSEKTSTTKQ